MLDNAPVKVLFRFQKTGKRGYSIFFKRKVQMMTVNSFTWLLPWSEEVIQKIHYIQINISIHTFPDYAFCIWHGIYFNR